MDDKTSFMLFSVVIVGIAVLISMEIPKDRRLTELCLSNGYSEQRRTSDEMYCIKRGVQGETIVINVKEIK